MSPGFFEILGVDAALGRTFGPDDERPGAPETNAGRGAEAVGVRDEWFGEGVRAAVRSLDPNQAVYDFMSMEQVLADDQAGNVAMVEVLGSLAAIAFLLTAFLASLVPAVRATRVDPLVALRSDRGGGRHAAPRVRRGSAARSGGAGVGRRPRGEDTRPHRGGNGPCRER